MRSSESPERTHGHGKGNQGRLRINQMNQRPTQREYQQGNLRTCLALALSVTVALLTVPSTHAQDSTIKIGDTGPEIKVEKLLQASLGAATSGDSVKGKVVVLEFWATWCLPCVPAIKHLNEVSEKFQQKSVQFIAITDEQDESLVQKFLNQQPIKGWVGLDKDRSVFTAYRPGGRPHTVVLDRDGNIAAITYAKHGDNRDN
jgi:thiol-disulfide isomerase/thioredoxin